MQQTNAKYIGSRLQVRLLFTTPFLLIRIIAFATTIWNPTQAESENMLSDVLRPRAVFGDML